MEKEICGSSDKKHILLTSLGMRAIGTKYQWDGETVKADLAPLALVQLLDPSQLPDHVVAVVTQGAKRETWQLFRAGICKTLKLSPELVEIPDGSSANEIRQILESVAKRIPKGIDLTLDVTQGFRHFPFIFYALVLYLKSLRGVRIRGAYYGMIEQPGDPKPIIDLQPLLELPEWFHAVRMFRDQGTTKPMADLLQPLEKQLRGKADELRNCAKKPPPEAIELYQQAGQLKNNRQTGSIDSLESYAFAYESALPLELGKASNALVDSMKKIPFINSAGLPPLVAELTDAIVSTAEKSAIELPRGSGKWKKSIVLDTDELERQAYMIDLYLDRGQLSLAVGLLREWVVTWAIWKSNVAADIKLWLDHNVRIKYENSLGAIGAAARSVAATTVPVIAGISDPKKFGNFWNQLTNDCRNALLHNAMREDAVEQPLSSLNDVRQFWNDLRRV